MRSGGPPDSPFRDPDTAKSWYEALCREYEPNPAANEDLAAIEDLRSRARAAWESNGDAAVTAVLADHFGNRGAPRRVMTNFAELPPPRAWLVPGWVTAGRVSLLVGSGGAGKSRLALQMAAAVAAGTSWIDDLDGKSALHTALSTSQVAVFATWEDEVNELSRRLHGYEGGLPEVGDRLHALDFAGCGPLWGPGPHEHAGTVGSWTDAGRWLMRYCEQNDARLLVLDPLAAAFGSDENARAVVRRFMSSLDGWARDARCTVLVIAHPPKSKGNSRESYSGSTDWHAAGRAMLALGLRDVDDGQAPCLSRHKGNYASNRVTEYWLAGFPKWAATDPHEAARLWGVGSEGDSDDANDFR